MKALFVHQNFPGQYRHIAAALAHTPGWEVVAMGELGNVQKRPKLPGVDVVGYPAPAPASARTHHYVRPLEGAVRRGQTVVRACRELAQRGFVPDMIYAHPGWGEALFLRDIFPNARLTLYCEFYYHARGADVGFDPEYPATFDDTLRVRLKNAASLISLETMDAGLSPTRWQHGLFPKMFRNRIEVIHEGVDTDSVKPDADAEFPLPGSGIKLTTRDEVVTYIARNLEPYRGFHIFMRAVPEIQRLRPRARILIVGNDDVSYGNTLPQGQTYRQKMLDELGARIDMSRCHFLGTLPYASLLRLYQVASAHVYLTYPFVLSWSMLEAMAAGCVVVASSTAPVTEVIEDRRNGFLVDFFNAGDIAQCVAEALERRSELAGIRRQARRTVVARYDLNRVCLPAHLKLLGVSQKKSAAK